MKIRSWVCFGAVILSACLSIQEACAQFGGAFGGARGGRAGGIRGGEPQGRGGENRNERPVAAPEANSFEQIDYRLSLLQEDLKLTGEQNTAWQLFASRARAFFGDLARDRNRGVVSAPLNAPPQINGLQHISQAVDSARNRLAALEEVESAAKALYKTLTPPQMTLADMRIPTIIAPRPVATGSIGDGSNLPDLGAIRR